MRFFCLLFIPVIIALGCTSAELPEMEPTSSNAAHWDGTVQQWGMLREVMHGEIMDGQVRLADATDKPHVVGIGAPDKLQGEILIADSVAWLARIRDNDRIVTRRSSPTDSAVFLAVAQVPHWTETKVDHDVSAEEFDDFIAKTLGQTGLDDLDTVPFVIEGRFPSLELHVLNGQCPFAEVEAAPEGSGSPYRTKLDDAQGLLVGFYSETGAGRITHHWTNTHVHALVGPKDNRIAGHVDAGAIAAGSIIRLPTHRSDEAP